jgi:hypothetical protein
MFVQEEIRESEGPELTEKMTYIQVFFSYFSHVFSGRDQGK